MADAAARRSVRAATGESSPARAALIAVGAAFLLLFVAVPLVAVFVEAFSQGFRRLPRSLVGTRRRRPPCA